MMLFPTPDRQRLVPVVSLSGVSRQQDALRALASNTRFLKHDFRTLTNRFVGQPEFDSRIDRVIVEIDPFYEIYGIVNKNPGLSALQSHPETQTKIYQRPQPKESVQNWPALLLPKPHWR